MKKKTIVSSITLFASLAGYYYAKRKRKDSVPYVMLAGFVGAVVGETIVELLDTEKKEQKKISNR